jgi:hypothetical protein
MKNEGKHIGKKEMIQMRRNRESIIVANASGFWGDELAAIERQVKGGPIDYLTMDYLAEITMIILARQKAKNAETGYARDFVSAMGRLLSDIVERDITVIANAGGINPVACARALDAVMKEKGIRLPVAIVDGDDLMPRLRELQEKGCAFTHQDTGEALGTLVDKVISANAYIGARPIVAALKKGARIVVTGRTYDAAGVVAAFAHEFEWGWEEYDKLASALVAGHLVECGTQSTGGNYTLWREVESHHNIGFPLVEMQSDGSFVLTKHPGTGGLVNSRTVKEQLLYEIGNPKVYISPDVIADFTSFTLEDAGKDRVLVKNARGQKPTSHLKVSVTYDAGYKVIAPLVVSGPDVVAKGKKFAEMFWGRVEGDFIEKRTDFVGYNACWGESAAPRVEPNEIVLRFAGRSAEKKPLESMSREVSGLVLAGPPGVTVMGGRPDVSPAFGFWPALIPRNHVTARMVLDDTEEFFPCDSGLSGEPHVSPEAPEPPALGSGKRVRVPLSRVAHARSGDKGDTCNIGVAALKPELYPEIIRELTAERVASFFRSNVKGPVTRYRLDNLCSLNFLLEGALGGGGTVSLLTDNQGKTLSQGLLTMEVEISENLLMD